jgi:phenylalanyl-tRNA synthetase alpha chain
LGKLSKEEKPVVGAEANRVKVALESALAERAEAVKNAALAKSLEEEKLDVTLPGRGECRQAASIHAAIAPRVGHSRRDGFSGVHLTRGGDDDINFQMLNFPPHHPARDMQDTFFIETGDPSKRSERGDNPILMRTHTSPGQIHAMRISPRPIRRTLLRSASLCPACASVMSRSQRVRKIQFNQVEGLAVGKNITFADLKGTIDRFRAPHVRAGCAREIPRFLLPVHGTLR